MTYIKTITETQDWTAIETGRTALPFATVVAKGDNVQIRTGESHVAPLPDGVPIPLDSPDLSKIQVNIPADQELRIFA